MSDASKKPPAPPVVRQARGCRPCITPDGDLSIELLDEDLKPFAAFTTDVYLYHAVLERMSNCYEKACGLPRSTSDH